MYLIVSFLTLVPMKVIYIDSPEHIPRYLYVIVIRYHQSNRLFTFVYLCSRHCLAVGEPITK